MALACETAFAQTPRQVARFRQGSMEVQQWHFRTLVAMLKGTRPFDQAQYLRIATILEGQAATTAEGFAPGSDVGEHRVLPAAWTDPAGLKAAIDRFQTESTKAVAAARSGDEKAMRAQGLELVRACDSCHDRFRAK
jgi:cytochrome c556